MAKQRPENDPGMNRASISAFIHRLNSPFLSNKTPENKAEVPSFLKEQTEALVKLGYIVYELDGYSIKSLGDKGFEFAQTWHKDFPDFEALGSIRSEVAINPNIFFLPESKNRTLLQ